MVLEQTSEESNYPHAHKIFFAWLVGIHHNHKLKSIIIICA